MYVLSSLTADTNSHDFDVKIQIILFAQMVGA